MLGINIYIFLIIICRDEDVPAILGGVVGCIALLAVFFGVFGYQWMQRMKTKENTMMMTMVRIDIMVFWHLRTLECFYMMLFPPFLIIKISIIHACRNSAMLSCSLTMSPSI